MSDVVQVLWKGDLLTVSPDDVTYDDEGNVMDVRLRGHGNGSEGPGTEGLRSAEREPSGV